MSETTVPEVYDGNFRLPPHVAGNTIRWLVYQYGMTVEEATRTMTGKPGGNTRQRQRQEAIDVADFVETLKQ